MEQYEMNRKLYSYPKTKRTENTYEKLLKKCGGSKANGFNEREIKESLKINKTMKSNMNRYIYEDKNLLNYKLEEDEEI